MKLNCPINNEYCRAQDKGKDTEGAASYKPMEELVEDGNEVANKN
ncbi:hypothetical protein [Turicimonas muris]|nr:hypothetical protein [Turicimonas muris]